MNKALAALLGIIVVAMLGVVGGYMYAEKMAGDMVDGLIANAKQHDEIKDISYASMDVNLIGDTITLKGLSVDNDVGALVQMIEIPQDMSLSGAMTTTFGAVRISGVRDLLTGAQVIPSISAVNIATDADIVQVLNNANLKVENGGAAVEKQNADVTSTIKQTSQTQSMKVSNLNIAPLMDPNGDLADLSVGSYSADATTMTSTIELKDNSAQPTTIPTLKFKYDIASFSGEDVSGKYIASARAEDIRIRGNNPAKDTAPIEITIGSLEISDTKLVDFFPTQLTYKIRDMVFEPPAQVAPPMRMLMAILGLEEINLDITVNYTWDEAEKSLSLAPVQFGLKKVGAFDVQVELFKLPAWSELMAANEHFDAMMPKDPQAMQAMDPLTLQNLAAERKAAMDALFAPVELKRLSLGYTDAGALKLFMAQQAQQLAGGNVEAVAQAFARRAAGVIAASHGPDKAREVLPVLEAYLADPGAIQINLSANEPVNLDELNKAVAIAGPSALGVFDLTVTTPD